MQVPILKSGLIGQAAGLIYLRKYQIVEETIPKSLRQGTFQGLTQLHWLNSEKMPTKPLNQFLKVR